MHVAHRLHIVLLAFVELFVEQFDLNVQGVDITIQHTDVVADSVDGTALVGNLGIDHLKILQTLLDVLAVGLQFTLLFLNLALQLLALALQAFDGGLLTLGF